MTTLETKTDSAAETGKNLHAWLLKIILACSKKYTMTYYCRFQCGNCVIMPTGQECSCCCEVERVSEDHARVPRTCCPRTKCPLSGHDVLPPPHHYCHFSSDRKLGMGPENKAGSIQQGLAENSYAED